MIHFDLHVNIKPYRTRTNNPNVKTEFSLYSYLHSHSMHYLRLQVNQLLSQH